MGVDELTGKSELVDERDEEADEDDGSLLFSELLLTGDACKRLFCCCKWCTAFRNELAYG